MTQITRTENFITLSLRSTALPLTVIRMVMEDGRDIQMEMFGFAFVQRYSQAFEIVELLSEIFHLKPLGLWRKYLNNAISLFGIHARDATVRLACRDGDWSGSVRDQIRALYAKCRNEQRQTSGSR